MKKTKIICTMGPNTDNKELLLRFAENGMDIARFNFSHGDYEEQAKRMDLLCQVRDEIHRPIAMLLDTKGPEIRTGLMENDKVVLEEGSLVTITTNEMVGTATKFSVTYQELAQDVTVGNRILIDDGLLELVVEEVIGDELSCRVIAGGELSSKKGVNVPNIRLNLPGITEQDKKDIEFGIAHGVDFIAASFVRNASAIKEIRNILDNHGADIAIIAKIENHEGVMNIEEIVKEADGVMVARGDLGVEIPAEEVPFIQKKIIECCNKAYKPVITATQMLDSMMRNARPTRAEVTDVANAIYDGTDAIMLSGETAVGKHPLEALQMMVQIAEATEAHLNYELHMMKKKMKQQSDVSAAVAFSSVATASNVGAKCIVIPTMSGFTARIVSKFRPESLIMGLSPKVRSLRRMQIYWGVTPIQTPKVETTDALMFVAVETVEETGIVSKGDNLVITAGNIMGGNVVTNMMKVVTIED